MTLHPIFCANSIHIIPWRRLSHVNLDNISVNNGSPKYQKTNYAPPTKWVEYHFAEFRSMCRRLRDVVVVRDDRKIEYIIYFLVDRHLRKAYVMRYLIFFFVKFVYLMKYKIDTKWLKQIKKTFMIESMLSIVLFLWLVYLKPLFTKYNNKTFELLNVCIKENII